MQPNLLKNLLENPGILRGSFRQKTYKILKEFAGNVEVSYGLLNLPWVYWIILKKNQNYAASSGKN